MKYTLVGYGAVDKRIVELVGSHFYKFKKNASVFIVKLICCLLPCCFKTIKICASVQSGYSVTHNRCIFQS